MEEIWKPVAWYEGLYEISSLWRIKSISRKVFCTHYKTRIIKEYIFLWTSDKLWYKRIRLIKKRFLVHRLVAIAFHDNRENYPYVMHLDNNPSNNRADNLKWGTQKHNMEQASKENRMTTKSIKQLTLDWNLIKIWNSAVDAKKEIWINTACICMCLKWKHKTAWWFLWEYY